eukprot:CAMPEP_0116573468 /NCGR_PEP_ID=MMETSP0397-20121206/18808_1 /TAXON_ID=216820 /ORGANISM="Cyclophora tenuis, Strain ECT3854" /LENGTH=160 /DNA_ID=CAMNT_0004102031 /DNA_START=75 /DNA_END=557 /DNA_ORIENTATION=-
MSVRVTWLARTLRRSLLQQKARQQQQQQSKQLVQQQQRRWGGDMPRPQSMDAELFGGHPKLDTGWKGPIYFTYAAATLIIGAGLAYGPESDIQTWAEAEARARLRLKEEKGFDQFEFGKHYNRPGVMLDFDSLKPENPFNEEDDDDDDEEEEDEEEGDDE